MRFTKSIFQVVLFYCRLIIGAVQLADGSFNKIGMSLPMYLRKANQLSQRKLKICVRRMMTCNTNFYRSDRTSYHRRAVHLPPFGRTDACI